MVPLRRPGAACSTLAAIGACGKMCAMSTDRLKPLWAQIAVVMLPLLTVLAATAAPVALSRTSIAFHVFPAATSQTPCDHSVRLEPTNVYEAITQYDPAGGFSIAAESAAGVSSTLTNFSGKVGQATDGVLGGFVKADGTVDFVPFTRNGLIGHTAAQSAGAIPTDAAGGFSISVQDGKVVGYNFQSVLNAKSPNFTLSPVPQQQIKSALSTVTATER